MADNNKEQYILREVEVCKHDLPECSCVRNNGWNKLYSYQNNNVVYERIKYVNVYYCDHSTCHLCKKCHLSTCDSTNHDEQCHDKAICEICGEDTIDNTIIGVTMRSNKDRKHKNSAKRDIFGDATHDLGEENK